MRIDRWVLTVAMFLANDTSGCFYNSLVYSNFLHVSSFSIITAN